MTNELLIALIGIASTFIGSWASWFFTRKKYNSEVDNTVISNLQEAVNTYKIICDDLRKNLETTLQNNATIMEKNDKLEDEIRDLRKQVNELTMSICYDLTCSARQKVTRTPKPVEKDEKH